MNKQDALTRLDAIEKEAAELRKLINQPEEKKLPTYDEIVREIKPKTYFGVDGRIDLAISPYNCCYADEATAEREAIRAKWLNIAAYYNKGKDLDWGNDKQPKYYAYCNHKRNSTEIGVAHYAHTANAVYFHSKQDALDAITVLGEDEFKKML